MEASTFHPDTPSGTVSASNIGIGNRKRGFMMGRVFSLAIIFITFSSFSALAGITTEPAQSWGNGQDIRSINLSDCQKDFIKRASAKDSTYTPGPLGQHLINQAKGRYHGMTRYDQRFIGMNPMTATALPQIIRNARDFADLTCGGEYKDRKQVNATYHFAMNMFAALSMGHKKACDWSTGHELNNVRGTREAPKDRDSIVQNITDADKALRQGSKDSTNKPGKKKPIGPTNARMTYSIDQIENLSLSANDQMDLLNNQVGLNFARRHPMMVKNCQIELSVYAQAKSLVNGGKVEKTNTNSMFKIGKGKKARMATFAKLSRRLPRKYKGACQKIWTQIAKDGSHLNYLGSGGMFSGRNNKDSSCPNLKKQLGEEGYARTMRLWFPGHDRVVYRDQTEVGQ